MKSKYLIVSWLICLALVVLYPTISSAQTQAASTRTARGQTYILCDAEDTTGVCDDGTSDYYAAVGEYSQHSIFFKEDPVNTGSTCTIYAASKISESGLDSDLSDNPKWDFIGSAMSASQDYAAFEGPLSFVWAECTIAAGGWATIEIESAYEGTRNRR